MPFFFDLSSLTPKLERNPFEPILVPDETMGEPIELEEDIAAEPIIDTGLPIPSHYNFDMMRAMVQDPFHLFVYWQLKDNSFDRLRRVFPVSETDNFHTVLKLIDETNQISVFFNAAFMRDYWFQVFPDRRYRVELGVHSARFGYIKLLSSQSIQTPPGGPSDQVAEEEPYQIGADDYLRVLRESHMVSERAFALDALLPSDDASLSDARNAIWNTLPESFRRLMMVMADIQAGRDYDRWWERFNQEELSALVREFLDIIKEMGDGEVGYMLLLRYLPELLRRAIAADGGAEIRIDKPISLYLAERLGQSASEMNVERSFPDQASTTGDQSQGQDRPGVNPSDISHGLWLPSMKG